MGVTPMRERVTPSGPRSGDDGVFEMIDGRLVGKQKGVLESLTVGQIIYHLGVYAMRFPTGDVLLGQSLRCFADDPDRVRWPEVSFVLAEHRPADRRAEDLTFQPDLVVEVVSPTYPAEALEAKLAEYEAAGVPLVWVVVPTRRVVRVYPPDGSGRTLRDGDTLRGDPVLPGFAVAVADLFPPRTNG